MANPNIAHIGGLAFSNKGRHHSLPEMTDLLSDNDSDEVDMEIPEDIKTKLRTALSAISSKSEFAGYGDLSKTPLPEIMVKDVGLVGLPLSETQARELIQKSHQAPFGKGSDTIIDTSVRKTWEINADQLELRQPSRAWDWNLRNLEKRIQEDLGIPYGVKAELYKMLIYEEGAMFKPHRDTEKIEGMFGTLVIALPSRHKGGEVVLEHCGYTKTYESAKYRQSFAYWYSNVQHEVKPVTSGHRLVLTYNLALRGQNSMLRAPPLSIAPVTQALEGWRHCLDTQRVVPRPLVHILEHEYSQVSLCKHGEHALKGPDRRKLAAVLQSRQSCHFDVFLATVKKEASGQIDDYPDYTGYDPFEEEDESDSDIDQDSSDDGHESRTKQSMPFIDDDIEITLSLSPLIKLDGTRLMKRVDIDEESFLDKKAFDEAAIDDQNEEFTGNEGATATYTYRLSEFMPFYQPSFSYGDTSLPRTRKSLNPLVQAAAERIVKSPNDKRIQKDTMKLCDNILSHFMDTADEVHFTETFFKLGIVTSSKPWLESILEHTEPTPNEPGLPRRIAVTLGFFEWLSRINVKDFAAVSPCLSQAIQRLPSLSEKLQATRLVSSDPQGNNKSARAKFYKEIIPVTLNTFADGRVLNFKDGEVLVTILAQYFDAAHIEKSIEAFCSRFYDRTSFMFGCLLQLRKEMDKPDSCLGQVDLLPFWSLIASEAEARMTLEVEQMTEPMKWTQQEEEPKCRVSPSILIKLWERHREDEITTGLEGLDVRSEELIKKIADIARPEHRGHKFLVSLLLPFLLALPESMRRYSVPLSHPVYGGLYHAVLISLRKLYVGNEPEMTIDRTYPQIGCRGSACMCKEIDSFLRDPEREVKTTELTSARRKHVLERLGESGSKRLVEYTISREPRATQETLRITKLKGPNEVELKFFNKRYKESVTLVQGIGLENLMKLLGEERYEEVVARPFGLPKPGAKRKLASDGDGMPAGKKQRSGNGTDALDLTGEE